MTRGVTPRPGDARTSSSSGLAVAAAEPPETDGAAERGSTEAAAAFARGRDGTRSAGPAEGAGRTVPAEPATGPAEEASAEEPPAAPGTTAPTPATSAALTTVTAAGGSLRPTADEDTDAETPDGGAPDAGAAGAGRREEGAAGPGSSEGRSEGRPEVPGGTAEGTAAGAARTVALVSDTGRDGDDAENSGRRISRESVIGVSLLALLVAGSSFLLVGSGGDSSASGTVESARGGFSQDGEDGPGGVPGTAASIAPSTRPTTGTRPGTGTSASPRSAANGSGSTTGEGSHHSGSGSATDKAAAGAAAAAPAAADRPVKSTASTPSAGQAAAAPSVQSAGALVGSASDRCADVTDGTAGADTPIQIWDCTGAKWQRWSFYSDGTVRSLGLCMEVASASVNDGAAIRLANCDADAGQRFRLNSAGDLVNIRADKCVDVKDQEADNGARLQLWTCTGAQNQKWGLR
ncbi:ricin-type beta-trefoil lectin domain protein [Streptomyces sp. DT193]|uniref:ricin-type beta-trefoil lectin domain protein n=1 Tax=Streptomyces sp. DT193 TaxID=3393418 RepID=UPI003CEEC9D9